MWRGRKTGRGILVTQRETREGVAGRRTERDVDGKRETLSSALFDHSCSPHLCFVSVRRDVIFSLFLFIFVAVVILSFLAVFLSDTVTLIVFT